MDKLRQHRKQIDELDYQIMAKLEARLKLMPEIYEAKTYENIPVNVEKREKEILAKTKQYVYSDALAKIYTEIFHQAKAAQFPTGLVGKRLSYSYSQLIHQAFGNPYYQLIETDDFAAFSQTSSFVGLNITNPYKKQAFALASGVSPIVEKTKVANLLYYQNGKYHAENVDYGAFLEMLDYYHIDCQNQKVLIFGNGATARTVYWACYERGATHVQLLGRTLHQASDDLLDHYDQYLDYGIIINTIPYGVFPDFKTQYLISFDRFTQLQAIIDVNYNPQRSAFIQEGLKQTKRFSKLVIANGLYMLVAGGRMSEEIWQNKQITTPKTIDVVRQIYQQHINIVLIGLPYSGKTTLGKALAYSLNKPFFDSDEILTSRKQSIHDVPTIAEFRQHEADVIQELATKQGVVIATGGGIVENESNIQLLAQNSIIIWLDLPLETLAPRIDSTRPLANSLTKLEQLSVARKAQYAKHADIIISSQINILNEMVEKINEYLNHQWPES